MRVDTYTKAVLTIIAITLLVIACNHYASPPTIVNSEGPLAGVQFLGVPGAADFTAIDTRTGDIWSYRYWDQSEIKTLHLHISPGYRVMHMGKLRNLGEPATDAPKTIQMD